MARHRHRRGMVIAVPAIVAVVALFFTQ